MNRITTPSPRRRRPKGVHPEDVRRLLEDAQGPDLIDLRDKAIILTLMDTAMRVGGLVGLKMSDVNLEAGTAMVVEKGGKVRTVLFTNATAEALEEWIRAAEIQQGPVFLALGPGSTGALTANGVQQMLRRRSACVGAEGPTNPHAFRHGFARFYLLDGGDLGTLSDLLGHEGVAITKNYYGVFLIEELKQKHHEHSPVSAIVGGNGHG